MSEILTASVEGYAAARAESIARRAGLAESFAGAIAAMAAAGVATVASMLGRFEALARQQAQALNDARLLEQAGPRGLPRPEARLWKAMSAARALLDTLERPEMAMLRAAVLKQGGRSLVEETRRLSAWAQDPAAITTGSAKPRGRQPASLTRALGTLQQAIRAGAAQLACAEAAELREGIQGALQDMGYQSSLKPAAPGHVVVKGTSQGGTAVYIQLDESRGHLVADFAGFRGLACQKEVARLLHALGQRGIHVRLRERHAHGDPQGGQLARLADASCTGAAAAAQAASLAQRVRNLEGR